MHRDPMACAHSPMQIRRVQEETDTEDQADPLIKYYQPLELRAEGRPLLGTAPAVLGVTWRQKSLFIYSDEATISTTPCQLKTDYNII